MHSPLNVKFAFLYVPMPTVSRETQEWFWASEEWFYDMELYLLQISKTLLVLVLCACWTWYGLGVTSIIPSHSLSASFNVYKVPAPRFSAVLLKHSQDILSLHITLYGAIRATFPKYAISYYLSAKPPLAYHKRHMIRPTQTYDDVNGFLYGMLK
jgi:hypothetical protein